MKKGIKKPNFFIIGAPKCGTTSLSEYLRTHPDIFFCTPKEPTYFNTDSFEKPRAVHTEKEYLNLFRGAKNYRAVGEGSTRYLSSRVAIKNILKFNSEAKFIVMVRHPADMFHSLFWHLRFMLKEDSKDPESAWKKQQFKCHIENMHFSKQKAFPYGEFCSLGYQLERVYRFVPRSQVFVIFLDDLKQDPRKVYQKTLFFLGLSDDGRKEFPVINERKDYRFRFLQTLPRKIRVLKKKLGIGKSFGILTPIQRLNIKNATAPPLSKEFRQELIVYFRDDIKKLSILTGRDLSHWLRN
jgi:hypothetical protein